MPLPFSLSILAPVLALAANTAMAVLARIQGPSSMPSSPPPTTKARSPFLLSSRVTYLIAPLLYATSTCTVTAIATVGFASRRREHSRSGIIEFLSQFVCQAALAEARGQSDCITSATSSTTTIWASTTASRLAASCASASASTSTSSGCLVICPVSGVGSGTTATTTIII